jgi:hypothetical protein
MTELESVSPAGLRARADLVRNKLNDSGSCARHLELAADTLARYKDALQRISEGYGPNHLSKYARDIAAYTLQGGDPSDGESFRRWRALHETRADSQNSSDPKNVFRTTDR